MPRPQGPQGRSIKGLPGQRDGRQCDQRRNPVKQIPCCTFSARPDRDRQQHHIARCKTGDGKRPKQAVPFPILNRTACLCRIEGTTFISLPFDSLHDGVITDGWIMPDAQTACGQVQPCRTDTLQLQDSILDPGDTARAMHTRHQQLQRSCGRPGARCRCHAGLCRRGTTGHDQRPPVRRKMRRNLSPSGRVAVTSSCQSPPDKVVASR